MAGLSLVALDNHAREAADREGEILVRETTYRIGRKHGDQGRRSPLDLQHLGLGFGGRARRDNDFGDQGVCLSLGGLCTDGDGRR